MMGAVAAAARAGGARTVGVIPQSMVEREWADHASDELLVVDSMRERKAQMEARADAFLALPGGLGTCEELFEIWTSGYLRLHASPADPLHGRAFQSAYPPNTSTSAKTHAGAACPKSIA